MLRFLNLPILFPVLMGLGLLILHPESRKTRNLYLMTAVLITSALSFAAIGVTYVQGSDALACIMVRFNDVFSISLRIDGASMVFGTIVSTLWPIITVYAIDYMSHEGSENRFFSFWLMAYGVVLGVAYSEDFLSLYLFYELLTLSTLPLVMHAADENTSSTHCPARPLPSSASCSCLTTARAT